MRRPIVHAIYLGLSLLFAGQFFHLLHPTSFAITEGDPMLMNWTLQWVSRALVHDPSHLFAGNTFYPYTHAAVLTDTMLPLAVLNVPVRFFTSNPWVGHNLLIVLAYYLSCVWGAWLVREVTGSEVAAVWGGIFWAFLFYRVHQIGHLQILSCQAIPAAVAALLRFSKHPGVKSALLAVVIAAAIVPVLLPYRTAFADSTLAERNALVNSFGDAVHLADFVTPPLPTLLGQRIADNKYWIWGENTLYIGFVPLLLCLASVVSAFRRTDAFRRTVFTGLALVVTGYILALGFVSPSLP